MNNMFEVILIIVIIALLPVIIRRIQLKEANEIRERRRKDKLKTLYEERETREIDELFDNDKFWQIIDKTREKSFDNYHNQLNLINDILLNMEASEIIKFENSLIIKTNEALTWDLYAISTILFKSQDLGFLYLLISMIISKGEIIYNNSLVNVNILINQDFKQIDGRTFFDITQEVYYKKTRSFIPRVENLKFEIQGDEWTENELPRKYPEIWDRFA